MAAELTLRVITPEEILLETTASSIRFPALDGSMGVLSRHSDMVAALDAGELRYQSSGSSESLFVSGGFAEVRGDTVRIVSEVGEGAGEIDVERARAAEKRARERLAEKRSGISGVDLARAQSSLRRALMRLTIAERKRA